MDIAAALPKLALFMPTFLFALCFHELAHGWVAKKLGDNTAELMGRLSMNPMVHADMFGTFILPAFAIVTGAPLFGWAKPVPVNGRNLKNPIRDMFWIAIAGPLSNLLLAIIGCVLLFMGAEYIQTPTTQKTFLNFMDVFIFFNLLLAIFNMIPLHPLDGGKVLQRFIPEKFNQVLEQNQMILQMVLLGLLFTGGFTYLTAPIRIFQNFMMTSLATLFG